MMQEPDLVRHVMEVVSRLDTDIRELETHPGGIFRRLALHVLLLAPERELVSQRLTDPALFQDPDCFVEFGQLLRAHFTARQPEDRARITTLIDEGPATRSAPEQDGSADPVFDWEPVLAFAAASLTQPRLLPGRPEVGDGDQDPGWSWAWQELAELCAIRR
jgi:hypothetical protein